MSAKLPPASARFPDRKEPTTPKVPNTGRSKNETVAAADSAPASTRKRRNTSTSVTLSSSASAYQGGEFTGLSFTDVMTSVPRDPQQRGRGNSFLTRVAKGNAMSVFVRVRPFSQRELNLDSAAQSTVQIDVEKSSIITVYDSAAKRQLKSYSFARCFWSVFDQGDNEDTQTLNAVNKFMVGGATNVMANSKKLEICDPNAHKALSGAVAANVQITHPPYAGQREVYHHVGRPILNNVLDGFNGCIFAYGQTGSGKTFTMMGYAPTSAQYKRIRNRRAQKAGDSSQSMSKSDLADLSHPSNESVVDPLFAEIDDDGEDVVDKSQMDPTDLQGIIPRICSELFAKLRAKQVSDEQFSYLVTVSYYEIYKEKVFDLTATKGNVELKVREHPVKGPFVENLFERGVLREEDVSKVIHKGLQMRHTKGNMYNDYSSRSHAILTMNITLMHFNEGVWKTSTVSKLNLIDLAGSERTGAHGVDITDAGVPINLSLTALGRVIDFLADLSQGKRSGGVPPYRDTKLTWLLRDSIGGNSLTSMIATISPHVTNTQETVQTLLYASRAKEVINRAHRNEDPVDTDVRKLREYIAELESRLKEGGAHEFSRNYVVDLQHKATELEDRCGDQAMTVDRLRAELSLANLIDPTAEPTDDEDAPTMRARELRQLYITKQQELETAKEEITRLHNDLLQGRSSSGVAGAASAAIGLGGESTAEMEKKLSALEKKHNTLLADHRDMDRLLLNYNLYQFNWTVDALFDTVRAKSLLLSKAYFNALRNKESKLTSHYTKGQGESLQAINEINRRHQEELVTLTQRHRVVLEEADKDKSAQRDEMQQRHLNDIAAAEARVASAKSAFEKDRKKLEQECEDLKMDYSTQLARATANFDAQIAELRASMSDGVVDRQKINEERQQVEEAHTRKLKEVKTALEELRKTSSDEIRKFKAQLLKDSDTHRQEVDEKDRQRRKLEVELSTLRRDNVQLVRNQEKREKEIKADLKDSEYAKKKMTALCNALINDYDNSTPGLSASVDNLRELLNGIRGSPGSLASNGNGAAGTGRTHAGAASSQQRQLNSANKARINSDGGENEDDEDLVRKEREMIMALKAQKQRKADERNAEVLAHQRELYDSMMRAKGYQAGEKETS